MWRKLMRWLLAFFVAGAAIVITIAITLYFVTDTQKVLRLVEQAVAEETGGKLTIGNLEFNAFSGFTGKKIRFDPPNIDGSPRSEASPEFVQVEELRLHYNLWTILYGTINITSAQLHKGSISVGSGHSVNGFGGISAFRIKSEKSLPEEKRTANPITPPAEALAKLSKSFWLPIRVKLSNIGFENLDFRIHQGDQKTFLRGVTLLVNTTAYWQHANIEANLRIEQAKVGMLDTGPLTAALGLHLAANEKTNGIEIEGLQINILNQLRSETKISLRPTQEDDQSLSYDATHKTNIDLDIPPALKKILPVDLRSSGTLQFEVKNLAGKITPNDISEKIAQSKINQLMPDIATLTLAGTNIHAVAPSYGINLKNMNFSYQVSETRSKDDNIHIQSTVSQSAESITAEIIQNEERNRAFLDKIKLRMETSLHFPGPTTGTTKLALTIDGAGIQGDAFERISVPISIDANADSTANLKTINAHTNMTIGDLIQQQFIVKCSNHCEQFEALAELEIPSVEKLWLSLKSNAARRIIPKFVPEHIQGSFMAKSEINGKLSSLPSNSLSNILRNIKFSSATNVALKNLSISIPANHLRLTNGTYIFSLSGTERSQAASFSHTLEEVTATLDGKAKKTHTIGARGLSAKANISTSLVIRSSINPFIQSNKMTFDTEVELKHLQLSDFLVKPLTNIRLTADGNASKLRSFTLNNAALLVPDLATTIETNGVVAITDQSTPQSFAATLKAKIADIPKDIVKGIDASGSISTEIELASKDMDSATLRGIVELQNLSATITSPKNHTQSITIEQIDGTLPLFQMFQFSGIKTLAAGTKSGNINSTASDPQTEEHVASVEVNDETLRANANLYLAKMKSNVTGDTRLALNEDYSNFRNFYGKKRPIRIKSINTLNLAVQNIEIDAELSQNQLAINNAVASFLGGKLQADFKLAFDDKPLSVKTSFHATRINTEKLVKTVPGLRKKAKSVLSSSNPLVDGAIHLNYDLRTGDMQGGLDITSIGKDQLRMILYYIDPADKDATINTIKTALHFGDVKLVSVPIRNGEIGLEVNLRLLAAPIPTPKLQGFPIAKLINNFREQGESTDDPAH